MLQPVGAGEPTFLGKDGIAHNPWARFFPDGERIVFSGIEPPRGSRLYVQRLPAGKPVPISPEGFGHSTANAVNRDGLTIAAIGPDGRIYLCPAERGEPCLVPGSKPGELVAGWDPTGPALLVFTPSELPVTLYRLGLGGERRVWRTLGRRTSLALSPFTALSSRGTAVVTPTPWNVSCRTYILAPFCWSVCVVRASATSNPGDNPEPSGEIRGLDKGCLT
jgi:hypothetical protein